MPPKRRRAASPTRRHVRPRVAFTAPEPDLFDLAQLVQKYPRETSHMEVPQMILFWKWLQTPGVNRSWLNTPPPPRYRIMSNL